MKTYTFRVRGSFELQHSFTESEIHAEDGSDSDVIPTDAALSALRAELQDSMGQNHSISDFDIDVESSDDLLGVDDHEA